MPRRDILRHRLRVHGLAGAPFTAPVEVVRWMGAMQSQEYAVAKWSIGQRARDVDDARVAAALADGAILRTHVLRPTWHFVLPADIRWMLRLTAPRIRAGMASTERRIGLDADLLTRSRRVIAAALERGRHLTRAELATALSEAGIGARGQRLAHLVMHAELDAIICSGAPRGKQQTYALLDERAPAAVSLDRDEALAALATRYFSSHGPATSRDFRWWSSLTAVDAKRAIEAAGDGLKPADIDGRQYWFAEPAALRPRRSPAAHLLQTYDEYVIAYTESRDVLSMGGLPRPGLWDGAASPGTVLLDGRVAGYWRRIVTTTTVRVDVRLLRRPGRDATSAIREAAERYGSFVGLPVETTFSSFTQ